MQSKNNAQPLADAMENMSPEPYGVGVFELEEDSGVWEVSGYFTEIPSEADLALLATSFTAKPFVVAEVPDIDWVAHVKRELPPVEAGRFFVYGSHNADDLPDDKIGLLIEAAMAFGTGHHGTTLGCLRALDALATDGFVGTNVADIGCGTAVLGMAAAKIWPNPVVASDIDEVAVTVAETNVAANDMQGRVTCLEAAGFGHPDLLAKAPYDLVFANILKGPLVALAPDMAINVTEGGYAILSGILNEQADDVIAVYVENGFNLIKRDEIVDWTTLTLRR
jgi:ribosomal protein L11 methyltransferase